MFKYLTRASVLWLFLPLTLLATVKANAAFTNGGFEVGGGSFEGWSTIGDTSIQLVAEPAGLTEYMNDFSSDIGAASLIGNAILDGGSVRLTGNDFGQQGSLVIDDLTPGGAVSSFTASFDLQTGPGSVPPADGISFNLGPLPDSAFGEEGTFSGLAISFDTFANDPGGSDDIGIDVLVNGAVVATNPTNPFTNGAFVLVTVVFDADGTLDLTFAGVPIFTNLPTGFTPGRGDRFGFGGRTGASKEVNRIDNVHIIPTFADVGFGSGPTEGNFQALITTAGAGDSVDNTDLKFSFSGTNSVPTDELEAFLELPPGSLNSICPSCGFDPEEGEDTPTEGSAIKQMFFANAGDVFSFDFNFLTDEVLVPDGEDCEPEGSDDLCPDVDDFAFVMINPVTLDVLANVFSSPLTRSLTAFRVEDGFSTFSFTVQAAGFYTLGIGVVDIGDDVVISGLLVDNFSQVVSIDIRPFSKTNKIRLKKWGFVPVAILGSQNFDALQTIISTVRFGPNGAKASRWLFFAHDINHDGFSDLTLFFKTRKTGIQCGDTEATLIGATFGGKPFIGTDAVKTVGCPGKLVYVENFVGEADFPTVPELDPKGFGGFELIQSGRGTFIPPIFDSATGRITLESQSQPGPCTGLCPGTGDVNFTVLAVGTGSSELFPEQIDISATGKFEEYLSNLVTPGALEVAVFVQARDPSGTPSQIISILTEGLSGTEPFFDLVILEQLGGLPGNEQLRVGVPDHLATAIRTGGAFHVDLFVDRRAGTATAALKIGSNLVRTPPLTLTRIGSSSIFFTGAFTVAHNSFPATGDLGFDDGVRVDLVEYRVFASGPSF